jgi:hypothetical protein
MSLLTQEQVEKFKKLYRSRFGNEISHEDAIDQGIKLINLMSLILKAMAVKQANDEAEL